MDELFSTVEVARSIRCERSLRYFIERAWHLVEPGTKFVQGRHIDAICLHLEAVTRQDIRNLLINIPPRFAKSLVVSVFWPVWVWINHPEKRFLFASYSGTLSMRDAVRSRRIIESPWFQARWGDRFQLTTDQNTKGRYENDRTGHRIATSTRGAVTGEGGDFVVVDDPHNVSEGESAAITVETCQWWDETMSTRLNDPKTGCRVVIMQRISQKDLSEHLIKKGNYQHLCLPMEYEPERHCRTSIGWEDWRKVPGELLWGDRMGAQELSDLKKALGSFGTAGQLQQRPAPRGGGLFQRHWFGYVGGAPDGGTTIRYWDRAATLDGGDWTVGLLMRKIKHLYYVMNIVRLQGSDLDVLKAIRNTASQDSKRVKIVLEGDGGQAGKVEMNMLIRELAGYTCTPYWVTGKGDKEHRAGPAATQAEAGNIKLVVGDWNETFLDEVSVFPHGQHDDQVDTLSGSFNYLSQGRRIFVG